MRSSTSIELFVVAFVGLALILNGCDSGQGDFEPYTPPPVSEDDHDHSHEHPEFGPHEGHIIELGDHEYHAELVFDPDTKTVTVYLLGHDLDESLPVELEELTLMLSIDGQEQAFALEAAPLEGEAEGESSRFELSGDPIIAEHIADVEELAGHVEVTIKGTEYKGEITHDHDHGHDHGHGDHDHGDDHEHEAGHDHDEDGEHSEEAQPE